METLTIQRSKWRRGGVKQPMQHGLIMLLNQRGYMCCLGFVCRDVCKLTEGIIFNAEYPDQVAMRDSTTESALITANLVERMNSTYIRNTNFTQVAVNINDDSNLTDAEREQKLIELFAANGITVVFED